MSAKENILQRLRKNRYNSSVIEEAGTLPARQMIRTPVDEFVVQAEISGAQLVRCMSEADLEHTKAQYHTENATIAESALAIAETGSVALRSIDHPSGAIYLCDHLVVCVAEGTIVRYLHEGLAKLKQPVSRAVHLMTGPSRTADVEQTIQIGAHGPRQLTIVIYQDK